MSPLFTRSLVRLITVGILFIASIGSASAVIRQTQEADDSRPVFEAALPRLNERAVWGESYALTEVKAGEAWAYAIAQPIPGTSVTGITPHIVVPLIGIFDEASGWQIVVPSPANAAEFNTLLKNLPVSLMDKATKAYLEQPLPRGRLGAANALNFSGHRLPWSKDLIAYAFSKDASGHVNQVDFDIQGLASTGDVVASKPGTVVFVKESSSSGSCSTFSAWKQANMVVVQHGPGEYSWYVHLTYNSVPVKVGDAVTLGTKLGMEGETGFACGKHVHFMVSSGHTTWTNPDDPNAAPWASTNSLAPTDFVEVSWSSIQSGQTYTSQNDPVQGPCPAPALQSPNDGFISSSQAATFVWSSVSNCPFNGYTLRVKNTADMNAGGTLINETNASEISRTLTISSTWNYRDLYWSVRADEDAAPWATAWRLRIEPRITGAYTLYSGANFTGNVFSSSQTITDLQTINVNDWARSLKLDEGIGIIACTDANLHGECGHATGPAQFNNLDGFVQGLSGNLSSIRACAGACPPSSMPPTLISPITGQTVLSGIAVTLKWQGDDDFDNVYRGELWGGALTEALEFGWITEAYRVIGALSASDQPYHWRVRASNGFGDSAWAQTSFLIVPSQNVYLPILRH